MPAGRPDLEQRIAAELSSRYVLEAEIGHGGMAHVLRAHDSKLSRDVAVKVLRPEIAGTVGTDRFLQEIDIVARLQHPLIVPIHDSGSAAGLPFFVMPYVEGESLKDRVRRVGELPVEAVIRITHDVAEALAFAHGHGVVHRDIKPENILLCGERAMLADFGIAHALAEAGGSVVTETGIALGTPHYMSPEQSGGERTVDARSDIYSLGCVMYEMLAGGPPFEGPSQRAVIARHLHEDAPSLRVVRPAVPSALVKVVKRCLQKSPADRFQSAAQLMRALDRLTEPVWRGTRLRQLSILAAGVSVALLGLLVWTPKPHLDDKRIVVFPLGQVGESAVPVDAGVLVAGVIASALEYTEPLTWLPGAGWSGTSDWGGPQPVTEDEANRITKARGARYRIGGDLLLRGDTADVVLRLYDVQSETQVMQRTVPALASLDGIVQSGLQGIRQLLPALLSPGRRVDWAAFEGRNPSAVVRWMQGEQAYRAARFAEAVDLYQRALERDSTLAMAALKGAMAVGWLGGSSPWMESAAQLHRLLTLAIAHERLLPPRHRNFAHGLRDYYEGRPDSALVRFTAAMLADSLWLEPRVMIGQTYGDHLTSVPDWHERMRESFELVLAHDSEIAPAALELSEDALRSGDYRQAEDLLGLAERTVPDPRSLQTTRLAVACLKGEVDEQQWRASAERFPLETLASAVLLGDSDAGGPCALAGFEVLRATVTNSRYRWGTLVAYQSFLLGSGRRDQAEHLLDSESLGPYLRLVGTTLGLASGDGVESLLARFHAGFRSLDAASMWLYGQWVAQQDSVRLIGELARVARQRADSTERRVDGLVADVLEAHAALMAGDTLVAIRRFEALKPSGTLGDVAWQPWESFPVERLMLAEVLMDRREYQRSDSVLALLEHPQPLIYRAFQQAVRALKRKSSRSM